MGRKKIEIQPITHERNRSVTFLKSWHSIYIILMSTSPPHVLSPHLKRKNGLFKKAYELGVLCSVDVAVIIFEERPGHHLKLYQYCSADINDIVQRHIRHDGEKDHKGPADFSGNNNPKLDDIGDDNDDDGDEDDEVPSRNKRGRDGKLKPPPDMHVGGMDYGHRSLAIPQAPSLSMGIGPQNSGPGLPISSDRLSNLRHTAKRGRIEINPQSRSPSDDPSNAASYYQQSSATPFAAARQTSGYHHPSHHQGNPQYTPFFSPQTTPSFIQSGGAGHSSRAGPGYGLSHHAGASSSAYDSAPVYPNIMGRTGSTAMTSSTSAGSSGGGLFPPFLDTDEQGRHQQHPQAQQTGFGSLEWPVHSSGNSGSSGAHTSLPESVSNPQPPTDSGGQNSNSHWLDFLSSNNSASSASNAREIMSWERGGGPPSSNSDLYGERSRPGTAGSPLIAGILNTGKRSPGGLLTSPLTGVNGRDDSKDSIPPG